MTPLPSVAVSSHHAREELGCSTRCRKCVIRGNVIRKWVVAGSEVLSKEDRVITAAVEAAT